MLTADGIRSHHSYTPSPPVHDPSLCLQLVRSASG
ncbi:hypothetical protein GBF38_001240, partial [Nibea albiflora]